MDFIKGKKGIIFTFIAILLVVLISVLFSIETSPPSRERSNVVLDRITVADDYIKNLEYVYLQRALYISSYRSIEALALYVNKTGFLSDEKNLTKKFKEILLNGTVNGVNVDSTIGRNLISGKTYMIRLEEIENSTRDFMQIKINFTKDYDKINVSIFQDNFTGPFKVRVNMSFEYFVDAQIATWNRTGNTSTEFFIEGIEDPLYLRAGEGMSHPIKISNLTIWNRITVTEFIANGMYRYENMSSSFLTRFYNGTSRSECCGIESIVPPVFVAILSVGNKDLSYVDCDFISNFCVTIPDASGNSYYNITGITNDTYNLQLDNYTVERYNLSQYKWS